VIACIGPATAAAARELGLRVDVMAETASTDALVDALVAFAKAREEAEVVETAKPTKAAPAKAAKAAVRKK
jgi:uroporphyrinogen III methyltransferase/synthase